jgi:flavodoxin
MKILILYESRFGNGKKLSEELAAILNGKAQDAEAISIHDVRPGDLSAADVYVFSSPTRIFMLPISMRRFIRGFSPKADGSRYALMTTYMDPKARALKVMEKLIGTKKMAKAAGDLKVRISDIKGPLEEGYRDKLEKFADDILESLQLNDISS